MTKKMMINLNSLLVVRRGEFESFYECLGTLADCSVNGNCSGLSVENPNARKKKLGSSDAIKDILARAQA